MSSAINSGRCWTIITTGRAVMSTASYTSIRIDNWCWSVNVSEFKRLEKQTLNAIFNIMKTLSVYIFTLLPANPRLHNIAKTTEQINVMMF